ncbi:MAG: hypothetical protein QMD25_07075 [Caldisericia bacterium]|jgi:hypothetical protein|nr:hypothetical protein [Caldisericia bacterium]
MKLKRFYINLIWGFSVILLNTFFIWLFKGINPIIISLFLPVSIVIITLLIEPNNYFLLPIYYIISKILLLLILSFLTFIHNPWILLHFYNGDIFLKINKLINYKIFIEKSFDAFKIICQFKIGFIETIFVILGLTISLLIRKFIFKKNLKIEFNNFKYTNLILFGLFTFSLFYFISNMLILYGLNYLFLIYLTFLISIVIGSYLFLIPFYRKSTNRKKFILYFYPLLSYYFALFLIEPFGLIINILNRIYIFHLEAFPFILIGIILTNKYKVIRIKQ